MTGRRGIPAWVVALAALLAAPAPVLAQATPDDPEPVTLLHPTIVDTATLAGDGQTVSLFGITGLPGKFANDLHGAIAAEGDRVTCQALSDSGYTCLLLDGTDVAALALRNGMAKSGPDAPDGYRDLEAAARDDRVGVWGALPAPPLQLQHPTVVDTGTLSADGQTYTLNGVLGLGGEYAHQLQAYIAASGDVLKCSPQGGNGNVVCLLPDGTDVAVAALLNGAARVARDASDDYRIQQGDAVEHRRGFWHSLPQGPASAVARAPAPGCGTKPSC